MRKNGEVKQRLPAVQRHGKLTTMVKYSDMCYILFDFGNKKDSYWYSSTFYALIDATSETVDMGREAFYIAGYR